MPTPSRCHRQIEGEHLAHVVAGVRASDPISVAISVAAPASSTNENAICVVANTRSRRFVPGVMRTLPLASPIPVDRTRVRRRQLRHICEQHRSGHRQGGADPQQARIHRHFERSHREPRREAGDDRHHGPREQHAEHGTCSASTRLSASSVRRSAPLLAPSAARTASSPSRRTERARIRFATLEHAMMKTMPAATSNTSRIVRAGDAI